MRFIYVIIGFSILASSCITEESPEPLFPKSFDFDTYLFESDIKTYNSLGFPISAEPKFEKTEFLEPLFYGGLPLKQIDLMSSSEAIFFFSDNDSTYSKEGVYTINQGKLEMEIFFGHRVLGSLYFSCDYIANSQLSINAFGYKVYGPLGGESSTRFGEIDFEDLLIRTGETDTLYIQKYSQIYNILD